MLIRKSYCWNITISFVTSRINSIISSIIWSRFFASLISACLIIILNCTYYLLTTLNININRTFFINIKLALRWRSRLINLCKARGLLLLRYHFLSLYILNCYCSNFILYFKFLHFYRSKFLTFWLFINIIFICK